MRPISRTRKLDLTRKSSAAHAGSARGPPRMPSGRPTPFPRCRTTSRQAAGRKTPNAEARGCVGAPGSVRSATSDRPRPSAPSQGTQVINDRLLVPVDPAGDHQSLPGQGQGLSFHGPQPGQRRGNLQYSPPYAASLDRQTAHRPGSASRSPCRTTFQGMEGPGSTHRSSRCFRSR
jgi:hypothetical protein